MDTPKRNGDGDCGKQQQTRTPMGSRVEDSPVFIYINNLSPMKPVKPVHIAQTIHSLSLPPVSSIFTTPHITTKDSKFLTRYPLSDLSKPDFLCGDVNGAGNNLCRPEIANAANLPNKGDGKLSHSLNETDINPTNECSTLPSTQPEPFHYDCGSPYHSSLPCHDINSDTKCVMGRTSLIEFVHDDLDANNNNQSSVGFEFQSSDNDDKQPKELQEHDWEANMYVEEGSDLLFFDPSNLDASIGPFQNYIDRGACPNFPSSSFSQSSNDNIPTAEGDNSSLDCFHQNTSNKLVINHTGEFVKKTKEDDTPHILSRCKNQSVMGQISEKMDGGVSDHINNPFNDQVDIQQQRCMPRRCLTFEMAGARRKSFGNGADSKTSSSLLDNGKQAASSTPGISRIGLHLNSVASIPLDRFVQDVIPSAKQHPINASSSMISSSDIQNTLHNSISAEKSQEHDVQDLLIVQDCAIQLSDVGKSDDPSHVSPKNKRRRTDTEGDSCRRCNCKKSKCLKLYCECFAAGVYCVEPCSCQGCLNKPEHKDTVLATRKQIESRNPLAFAPKVIRSSEPPLEIGEETNKTPASARHKRGCNCKKSSCLKKYCECYQGGAGCSISCRCEGCKNTFGRKDGTMPKGNSEAESKEGREQQTRSSDEEKADNHQNATVNNNQQHVYENLPITPFQPCRPSIQPPFTSKGKPPRSALSIGGGSSATSKAIVKFEGPSTSQSISHSYFHVPAADDETRKNLLSDGSPSSGVKVISPSKKRISPPLVEGGGGRVSPSRKGCRKFTLKSKSISSFPSLTCDSTDELHPTRASSPSTTFNSEHL